MPVVTRPAEPPQDRSRPRPGAVLVRVGQIIAVAIGCVFGAVGVLASPTTAFVAWLTLAAMVGVGCVLYLTRDESRSAPAPGDTAALAAAAAAATVVVCVVLAGLVAVLGVLAAPVIALLLATTGTWVWRHRSAWRDRARAGTRTVTGPGTDRADDAAQVQRAVAAAGPPVGPAASTRELCSAWSRSYWLLRDLPPGPDRARVVRLREGLLDELERRDPDGFNRWLQTEPRAGSDPGRFLSADH